MLNFLKNKCKSTIYLNVVFILQVIIVFLAVLGFLPREVFLPMAGILIFFILFSSYENAILFILRSIPLFVALPITANFDSLNIWRILILFLFLKWFFDTSFWIFLNSIFEILKEFRKSFFKAFIFVYKKWKVETLIFLIFLVSFLSLFKAEDITLGVKRIIYFANAAMLFFLLRAFTQKIGLTKISKNILISSLVIVIVGFIQLFMSYFMTINNFVEFWALQVDRVLYGNAWSQIAIAQNTWFAYYNETIHLRMFSTFPDTHSFPLYLMMSLVFVLFLLYKKLEKMKNFLPLLSFILLTIFAIILTGTRGIWASFIFPVFILLYWYFRKRINKDIFKKLSLPFIAFVVLLFISAPVFASKQFKIENSNKESANVFSERLKSIVDTEEVSNKGRIYIWTESLKSIAKEPFLGVGINNFPVVLKENLTTTKAGSSAHNIYLNVASEIGLIGLLLFLLMIYEILKKAWSLYLKNKDNTVSLFSLLTILIVIWMSAYTMTDVAITDERALLMLMVLLGVLFSFKTKIKTNE